jgi:hypothetical protein
MKKFSSIIFLALLIVFIISIIVVKKWKFVGGSEGFSLNTTRMPAAATARMPYATILPTITKKNTNNVLFPTGSN